MDIVSVSSGCVTEHHRLGGLTTDIYVLTILGARNLRSRCKHGRSGNSSLLGLATFSLCHHREERELSGVSSYKDTNPIRSGPHLYDFI